MRVSHEKGIVGLGRSSGLDGREDSFETSAVGPAKVVLTARGGRWLGVSGSGLLQFVS